MLENSAARVAVEQRGQTSQADDALMRAIATGDGEAFRALYDRYRLAALNFLYRRIGDRAAAEDLYQELFLRIYRHAPHYRGDGGFAGWFYTIASNLCRDYYRRQRNPTEDVAETDEAGWQLILSGNSRDFADPAGQVEARVDCEAVRRAVLRLSPLQREIVVLREYEGLTYAEIAARTGIGVSTLKVRMHRALEALRRSLAGGPTGEGADGL